MAAVKHKVIKCDDYRIYRGVMIMTYSWARGSSSAYKIANGILAERSFSTWKAAKEYIDINLDKE